VSGANRRYGGPQPTRDWRDDLRAGDVIVSPRGDYRVVRYVSRSNKHDGFIWGIALAIRRRSWTDRPYTILTRADIKTMGFTLSNAKHIFRAGSMDVELYKNIRHSSFGHLRSLRAGDVVGVMP
jgi:hypothetical protein